MNESVVVNTDPRSFTSFVGYKRIASGDLRANALAVKRTMASDEPAPVLVFCDQTGRVVDIDTRGSETEMLARLPSEGSSSQVNIPAAIDSGEPDEPRGRGRPKLGVVAREITLLPRHWEWLASQPGGASVTLRKLVEEARRANVDQNRQRQAIECAYQFMSAMAGDMAGFEEASRALFANDSTKLSQQIETWPADIRDYVWNLAYGCK